MKEMVFPLQSKEWGLWVRNRIFIWKIFSNFYFLSHNSLYVWKVNKHIYGGHNVLFPVYRKSLQCKEIKNILWCLWVSSESIVYSLEIIARVHCILDPRPAFLQQHYLHGKPMKVFKWVNCDRNDYSASLSISFQYAFMNSSVCKSENYISQTPW